MAPTQRPEDTFGSCFSPIIGVQELNSSEPSCQCQVDFFIIVEHLNVKDGRHCSNPGLP